MRRDERRGPRGDARRARAWLGSLRRVTATPGCSATLSNCSRATSAASCSTAAPCSAARAARSSRSRRDDPAHWKNSNAGNPCLVVIGGNGSQSGSASLAREGFAVVGVPSTIDNDLYGNDVSIGCDTAINITLEAIDRLRTTASSHQRAFAVETMGRDCGYIGAHGRHRGRRVIALPRANRPRAGRRAAARCVPAR